MSARDTIRRFNAVAAANEETLKKTFLKPQRRQLCLFFAMMKNPYSDTYGIQHFDKHAKDYGRPPPGSKTEARGIKAGVHVCREILFLCETINENAEGEEPNKWIKFGKLFYVYSFYSDKIMNRYRAEIDRIKMTCGETNGFAHLRICMFLLDRRFSKRP
ncbi:hypothetical protein Y032_0003g1345 [Ancylostoma ceylanicum]|uniref:Costars domain-containing protein n=1 Tax=Ancylostoma ceylanicum TaxID=53326 RepID=A0A016VXG0_9BILA|nr:hypothetical protein Y032_0003g1345 [Ancylostoma ceylanicum]